MQQAKERHTHTHDMYTHTIHTYKRDVLLLQRRVDISENEWTVCIVHNFGCVNWSRHGYEHSTNAPRAFVCVSTACVFMGTRFRLCQLTFCQFYVWIYECVASWRLHSKLHRVIMIFWCYCRTWDENVFYLTRRLIVSRFVLHNNNDRRFAWLLYWHLWA